MQTEPATRGLGRKQKIKYHASHTRVVLACLPRVVDVFADRAASTFYLHARGRQDWILRPDGGGRDELSSGVQATSNELDMSRRLGGLCRIIKTEEGNFQREGNLIPCLLSSNLRPATSKGRKVLEGIKVKGRKGTTRDPVELDSNRPGDRWTSSRRKTHTATLQEHQSHVCGII